MKLKSVQDKRELLLRADLGTFPGNPCTPASWRLSAVRPKVAIRPYETIAGRSGDGPPSTEAVRKPSEFLQPIAQSEIFRDFFPSKRSEGSKKRTE
jgi:hypothetical protein